MSLCFFLYSYLHEVPVDPYNSKLYTNMLSNYLNWNIFETEVLIAFFVTFFKISAYHKTASLKEEKLEVSRWNNWYKIVTVLEENWSCFLQIFTSSWCS